MGTGPFAVPTCERLLSEGHDILGVVTRPVADPKAKKPPPRPVYDWARQHGLKVLEPSSINAPEAIQELAALAPDLFFVCDYGQILTKDCLAAARLGGINLHGSILPRHRGAAPVQWTLLRGDKAAGITVIHMTPRLDAGPALAVLNTNVGPDETAEELEPRLANLGVNATIEAVKLLDSWDGVSQLGNVQDQTLVTKARRFSKADGQLDFRQPAEYLARLVRACQPWPGTFAELAWPEGKKLRVIVRSARHIETTKDCKFEIDQPGAAVAMTAEQIGHDDSDLDWSGRWQETIAVRTIDGVLLISLIQPSGKRAMPVNEFLRGHPLSPRCNFVLPESPCQRLDA